MTDIQGPEQARDSIEVRRILAADGRMLLVVGPFDGPQAGPEQARDTGGLREALTERLAEMRQRNYWAQAVGMEAAIAILDATTLRAPEQAREWSGYHSEHGEWCRRPICPIEGPEQARDSGLRAERLTALLREAGVDYSIHAVEGADRTEYIGAYLADALSQGAAHEERGLDVERLYNAIALATGFLPGQGTADSIVAEYARLATPAPSTEEPG